MERGLKCSPLPPKTIGPQENILRSRKQDHDHCFTLKFQIKEATFLFSSTQPFNDFFESVSKFLDKQANYRSG